MLTFFKTLFAVIGGIFDAIGGLLKIFSAGLVEVNKGSMSFRVESNTVTGASPARTGWPAG
ncbi:MAG: hypothetical protein ACK4F8_14235, partial [Aquabacterium sp.]